MSNNVTIPKPTPTCAFQFHIRLPKQNQELMKESWGWPFLPFNKLGESSKINGFIGSLISHSSNVGLLQMEPKYITDDIIIKLGYK